MEFTYKAIYSFIIVSLNFITIHCAHNPSESPIYSNLKMNVYELNKKLSYGSAAPIAFFDGIFLFKDTLSLKMDLINYNSSEGIDLNKIYKDNPDIIRNRAKNGMALSFASHSEFKDIIPLALDSLNLIYSCKIILLDGTEQQYDFSTQELKEYLKDGYDKKGYLREILKSDLFFVNQTLPAIFDDYGNEINPNQYTSDYLKQNYTIMETLFLEGDNIVYLYSIPETDMTVLEMADLYNMPENQEALLVGQVNGDPFFKDVIERCAIAKVGMEHRFEGAKTGKVSSVYFPTSLLRKVSQLSGRFFDD